MTSWSIICRRRRRKWAESITGVPAAKIEEAAILYGSGDKGAIYYTLGITEHICGVENVQSLCNLALLTGNFGREGTGINPMRGQNNIQGAGDSGALPNNYAGFQPVTEPANQAKFEKAYGRKVDLEKGITKVTALEQCGDTILAMLIDGENTVVSDPDQEHCIHALKSLEHLVVIDIFLTETGELADVVLPATSWAETDGHFVNTERRIQRVRKAVEPQGEAKPDWWIIGQIALRMGMSGLDYDSPVPIFNELCELSPIYSGIDWELADGGQYQWPIPYRGHPGTPRLHEDEFENGRGKFSFTDYRDPAETIDEDYPLWLTTGRRLESYHTRTQTGRSEGINDLLPEETLEVHPSRCRPLRSARRRLGKGEQPARGGGGASSDDQALSAGDGLRQFRVCRCANQRVDRLRLRSNYTNGRIEGLPGISGTYCGENTVGRGLSHWEVGR